MNKQEIRRLALLAAAKVTLLVGPVGCHDEASREGARAPLANNPPPNAAPHTACALPAETVVVTPPPPPAATVPPLATVTQPPAPTTPSAVSSAKTLSPAACEALLATTDKKGAAGLKEGTWEAAWECCERPGAVGKHNFCTPWGPPAPPEMPELGAAPGEVA